MNYFELYIPAPGSVESEIMMAELADLPFESFEQGETCLKAYIRADELETCRAAIDDFISATGVQCSLTEIETVNWNSLWESNFIPVEVAGRCVIRAPFHPAKEGVELDLVITPKMSFGTGHHATTWLMTSVILDLNLAGKRGLDMGSGTGVLAIAALKRGAAHMDAVDIDQWAYENCLENAEANSVSECINPILGDATAIEGKLYDFILANINRNILLADMERYAGSLKEAGLMVVSGILEKDIPAITDKALTLSLLRTDTRMKDGWAAVSFIK